MVSYGCAGKRGPGVPVSRGFLCCCVKKHEAFSSSITVQSARVGHCIQIGKWVKLRHLLVIEFAAGLQYKNSRSYLLSVALSRINLVVSRVPSPCV